MRTPAAIVTLLRLVQRVIHEEEIFEPSEVDAFVENRQREIVPFARNEDEMPFNTDGSLNSALLTEWV